MAVTPEMARAELMRRQGSRVSNSGITPQLAKAELMRRGRLKQEQDPETPEEEGFLDYAKRGLARGARNALVGGLDTLDFLATPVREAVNLGAKAFGSERKAKPLGEEVAKGIDTLTSGYTAPRNDSERTSEAIGRALGSLPTGLGLGTAAQGLKYAPKSIETIGNFLKGSNAINRTNLATTGGTAGVIQSSLNENPENISSALGSGAIAGVGIPVGAGILGLLTGKGRQAAAARTGELLKINPEAVETFEKAGITPTLADVSRGKISKLITSKLEHLPSTAEPIREAKELQRNQILQGLGQGETGRNLSKAEIGRLGVKGAKQYEKVSKQGFNEKFSQVKKDTKKFDNRNIELDDTHKYFKQIIDELEIPDEIELFLETPAGKLYKRLDQAAEKNGGVVPYSYVERILKNIRDKITTPGEIGDVSQGELKQFAANLLSDSERSLGPKFKQLGSESYKNWKDVKKEYAIYAQEEIPKLNELYKKNKKGAVDAFTDILQNQKKGGEKTKLALQGLSPAEQIDFIDGINKQLGAKSDGSFSPLVWVRKYKGLEPESQNILLSPLNESNQKKVKYIADSIDHLKSTLEEANTSKTAYHAALGGVALYGLHSLGDIAEGDFAPAAKLAIGLFIGNKIAAPLLTNPKFVNWMHKGMKAKDLNHFQRNLDRVPKVGKFTRGLMRSVQTFQNDLNRAKDDKKNKEK